MSAVAKALETLEAEFGGEKARTEVAAQSASELRQFVIFHLQKEMFAVQLSEVQEIIRMPDVVQVPMSPPALQGIANLRGTVLPVVSLRRSFGFSDVAYDESTRVVVLDQGQPIGLIVDRMANVVTVEPNRIEAADRIRSTIDTDLLTGMIKGTDGESIVMILDPGQVVRREFSGLESKLSVDRGGSGTDVSRQGIGTDSSAADEDQLVSFEVAGQEYAFPIERVQEIVQLPDAITRVPKTSSHVLGVITLRDRLLPLVSLRDMFGLEVTELNGANKVVVISLSDKSDLSVGVVMDSVKEVLRVERSLVEQIPPLLNHGHDHGEIDSICRLNAGRRLVSVLSTDRMFDAEEIAKMVKSEDETTMSVRDENDNRGVDGQYDEEQFVVFRLMADEYGVPIDSVQEIVRVPDDLTRVPKTPQFIEGVINLRGVVLPVVDQRSRFSLARAERSDRQRIMVFTINGMQTGFIVDSVSEVMRIPGKSIGASPNLSDEQKRLIKRVANLEQQKRMILLLDVNQLLNVQEMNEMRASAH
jgi:purine-binding chemotaxis protein CheW